MSLPEFVTKSATKPTDVYSVIRPVLLTYEATDGKKTPTPMVLDMLNSQHKERLIKTVLWAQHEKLAIRIEAITLTEFSKHWERLHKAR